MSNDKKVICMNCVKEKYLQKLILDKNEVKECNYCKNDDKCIDIYSLAEIIDYAFNINYQKLTDNTDIYNSIRDQDEKPITLGGVVATEAIANATLIPNEAAEDIRSYLKEKYNSFESPFEASDYAIDTHYKEKIADGKLLTKKWVDLEKKLKQENRYFNQTILEYLDDIFSHIESFNSNNGESILKIIGPGTEKIDLFRARLFQSDEDLKNALKKPDKNLGPPPHLKAIGGRMNAFGISVFYGADKMESAIAEVRPLVGSKVVVGRFEILRPLKLLNTLIIENLQINGSIFDSEKNNIREKLAFLKNLCKRMVLPVLPNNENIEYLITQVISDYLSLKESICIDGIIYPTIQSENGYNVVLFNKSALVKMDRNYSEDEMSVYQSADAYIVRKDKKNNSSIYGTIGDIFEIDMESQSSTLRIDTQFIRVVEITGISFNKKVLNVNYLLNHK